MVAENVRAVEFTTPDPLDGARNLVPGTEGSFPAVDRDATTQHRINDQIRYLEGDLIGVLSWPAHETPGEATVTLRGRMATERMAPA
ncbi:MAG: hypothetical protein DLM60_22560 [Pseudonocardiales bacterium]|nr:MAG: hypothetical protein DLM60_22560 [Pseudonocardiales bacterium]